jgi:hypothetical protein
MASGHLLCACSRSVVALLCKSPILFSAIPFWWCAPTPQKLIVCPLSSILLVNRLSLIIRCYNNNTKQTYNCRLLPMEFSTAGI